MHCRSSIKVREGGRVRSNWGLRVERERGVRDYEKLGNKNGKKCKMIYRKGKSRATPTFFTQPGHSGRANYSTRWSEEAMQAARPNELRRVATGK